MIRVMGLFAFIPVAFILTVSFFVLCVLRKIEEKGLRAFGYVVAALLWGAALLVFAAGVYTISTGRHPLMCMMQEMMRGKGQCMMMGQGGMPMHGMMPGQADSPMMKR